MTDHPRVQLVYVSRETEPCTDDDLAAILTGARGFNAENNVTGMLVYYNGSFMQVIEGTASAIEDTLGRIQKDRRHHSIVTVSHQTIPEREFGAWRMSFVDTGGLPEELLTEFVAFQKLEQQLREKEPQPHSLARKLLLSFKKFAS